MCVQLAGLIKAVWVIPLWNLDPIADMEKLELLIMVIG